MSPACRVRSVARIAIILAASVAGAWLSGCGGVRYSGRVVVGPADIATVVPAADPRLTASEGVPGTLVEFLDDKGNRIGSDTSDATGAFGILVPVSDAPTRAITVRASGARVRASETLLYLPRDGGKILVNVAQTPSNER